VTTIPTSQTDGRTDDCCRNSAICAASRGKESVDEFVDPGQYLGGAVGGVACSLTVVLVVRDDAVVDRIGVVQLATARLGDQLLELTGQALERHVVDAGGEDD